jgi:hypothetical protein
VELAVLQGVPLQVVPAVQGIPKGVLGAIPAAIQATRAGQKALQAVRAALQVVQTVLQGVLIRWVVPRGARRSGPTVLVLLPETVWERRGGQAALVVLPVAASPRAGSIPWGRPLPLDVSAVLAEEEGRGEFQVRARVLLPLGRQGLPLAPRSATRMVRRT